MLGFRLFATRDVSADDDLFKIGASSIDLLQLKFHLQKRLKLSTELPVTTFFAHPIISDLAQTIDRLQQPHHFDPVGITPQATIPTKNAPVQC